MALKHRKQALSNYPGIFHQFQVSCPDCDEMFLRDRSDLNKHAKEVHRNTMRFELKRSRRKNKCILCNNSFEKNTDLIRHRHENHLEEYLDMGMQIKVKNIQCPDNDFFLDYHYFYRHFFNMHRGKHILHPEIVADYNCGSCDEKLIFSQHLIDHEKKVHTSPVSVSVSVFRVNIVKNIGQNYSKVLFIELQQPSLVAPGLVCQELYHLLACFSRIVLKYPTRSSMLSISRWILSIFLPGQMTQ